ncbi:MAG: bifunctional nicotinamidase/pyrazinamidase [Parachlamydiaceae bacterium]|nr:bifunctional nicotinamidase/pyrazinamidase [Parachlamydiaceae bacterium]
MTALILVDLQNDFMPGGALAVPEGNKILPAVNVLLQYSFDLVVASQDWHPENHGSFAAVHGKQAGETILLGDVKQILWPTHCVQGTHGANFVQGWNLDKVNKIVHKGTSENIDSYSVFFDNAHLKSTNLYELLRENQIKTLYIAGVATEYCVLYSVLDARKLGFEVHVVVNGCGGINLQPEDEFKALELMKQAGAHLTTSFDVKSIEI